MPHVDRRTKRGNHLLGSEKPKAIARIRSLEMLQNRKHHRLPRSAYDRCDDGGLFSNEPADARRRDHVLERFVFSPVRGFDPRCDEKRVDDLPEAGKLGEWKSRARFPLALEVVVGSLRRLPGQLQWLGKHPNQLSRTLRLLIEPHRQAPALQKSLSVGKILLRHPEP